MINPGDSYNFEEIFKSVAQAKMNKKKNVHFIPEHLSVRKDSNYALKSQQRIFSPNGAAAVFFSENKL